jgi:hypothetical protein
MYVNYTLSRGTWYHIAVKYQGASGTAELFVNGSSIGSGGSLNGSLYSGGADFVVGGSGNLESPVANHLDGITDDVRVWSRAH